MKGSPILNHNQCSDKQGINGKFELKFNLNELSLACFKGQQKGQPKSHRENLTVDACRISDGVKDQKIVSKGIYSARERGKTLEQNRHFNETVVFMHYDNYDVYIDNSTARKEGSVDSQEQHELTRKESECEDDFVSSCVRVVTQETDHTHHQKSQNQPCLVSPPQKQLYYYDMIKYYQPRNPCSGRNRRSVTVEESRNYIIPFQGIEADGRTTIMIRNIPNKYTQSLLLTEISVNHEGRFDFFYLPIDKDNNCNVGYAFINFQDPAFIKPFYQEFHMKKWKKYRSPKICELTYARYQGTLELAYHFKNTRILERDQQIRPLIGFSRDNEIKSIIQNQRDSKQ